jgi:hypothetical protein
MRLIALAMGMAVASPVCAQTVGFASASSPSAQTLNDVAFVGRAPSDPGVGLGARDGFTTPDFIGESLSGQPALAGGRVAATGEGLIAWRSSQVSHAAGGGAVDTMRLSTASVSRTPLLGPNTAYDTTATDVTFVRGWPSAMIVRAGVIGVNVTPHAGVGFGSAGGSSAEAGATLKIGSVKDAINDRLSAMGVKNGASAYGNQSRIYLFAAVRGQAVGLNMQQSNGSLQRAGWSTDQSSALIGDGQVGVGWRKGGLEATMGYVHRGVHVKNAPLGVSDSYADDMAALSLTKHW